MPTLAVNVLDRSFYDGSLYMILGKKMGFPGGKLNTW